MITINSRTAKDGSLFFYPDDFKLKLEHFELSCAFQATELKFIEAIIDGYHIKDSNSVISVKDLCDLTKQNIRSVRYNINKLKDKNILCELNFRFIDSPKGRVSMFQLQQVETANVVEAKKAMITVAENRASGLKQRYSKEKTLRQYGFWESPQAESAVVVRHQSNYPFEQLLAFNKEHTAKIAGFVKLLDDAGTVREVPAVAKSSSRIVNTEDLQTFYAITSLTHAYHESNEHFYIRENKQPENKTPIHISDILKLRKVSRSKPAYDKIRASVNALRDTVYDFNSLKDIEIKNEMHKMFATERYSILEATPLSDREAQIVDNNYIDNATAYIVRWPESFFASLMSDKTLYSFPQASLAIHPTLFLMYLFFRNMIKAKHTASNTFSQDLTTIHRLIARNVSYQQFRKDLQTGFKDKKAAKHCNVEIAEGWIRANLFGYKLAIDFNEGMLSVYLDNKEMLAALNITSEKQTAPTIENVLSPVARLQQLQQAPVIKGSEERIRSVDGVNVTKRKFVTTVRLSMVTNFTLTHYNRDEDCAELAQIVTVQRQTAVPHSKVLSYILQLRNDTSPISQNGVDINLDTVGSLCNELSGYSQDWSLADVVDYFTRRKADREMLVTYQSTNDEALIPKLAKKVAKVILQ